MPSKRSFCNLTLLKKNLTRFWPLWGGASLVGFLIPLWMLLNLGRYGMTHIGQEDFAFAVYTVAAQIVPAISFVYAILCAMMVWSYLFSPRSVGLMHALPVDRTCLFITNALSGLAMMLIPYVTTGSLVCLVALGWGFLDIGAALEAAAIIILISLIFFGLATFCAMVTGNVFALPAFYVVLNFVFPALEALVNSFSQMFLVGVTSAYSGVLEFLSPLIYMVNHMRASMADGGVALLEGAPIAAVYGLVGIALMAAAFLLYRGRRSECAGDVVAFRWLRPVFRYGVALAFALTLGWMLYELIWGSLFQRGQYAEFVPMAVCMAVTGIIGYYVASMLLEKSLRVFRRSWPGVLTVCAGVVILCGCVRFDVLGMESRVPRQEDVAQVMLSVAGREIQVTAADAGYVDQILELHRTIAADADYIRADEQWSGENLFLRYEDSDGNLLLRRNYRLPLTEERSKTPGTYDYLLRQLLEDPQLMEAQVALPQGSQILEASIDDYGNGRHANCEGEEAQAVYEAILQDAREGHLYAVDIFSDAYVPEYPCNVHIRAVWDNGRTVENRFVDLNLSPVMTHTIQALLDQGLLEKKAVEQWNEEIGVTVYDTVSA